MSLSPSCSVTLRGLPLSAALVVLAIATGCGRSTPSSPTSIPTPAVSVASISVSGTAPPLGAAAQFAAIAHMSDGATLDVTAQAAWESSNQSVVKVSTAGVVNSVGAGEAVVSASYRGSQGTQNVALVETLNVPSDFLAALALIDGDPRPLPILGEPAGVWLRRHVRGIQYSPWVTQANNSDAWCCFADGMILWHENPFPNHREVTFVASLILHEARHADLDPPGAPTHSCPDGRKDASNDTTGPFAVQLAWLYQQGTAAAISWAKWIEAFWIGC